MISSKLFIIIGSLDDEDSIKQVIKNIEFGIEKWIAGFSLQDQEEMLQFLNNIPLMKSIPNRHAEDGTVVSRYRGRILDATVLINPTSENLHYEVTDFFLAAPSDCLIVYGGFVSEHNGNWILQDGLFSIKHFQQIFKDSKVVAALSEHNSKVTISCAKIGLWSDTEKTFTSVTTDSKITIDVMDAQMAGINSDGDHIQHDELKKPSNIETFSTFLEEGIGNEISGIFTTLKPPLQEGFLKIRSPCIYIFPGGNGDSAFFAVNGFNMLVNGGSCTKPWFWKLIQHVDRVDSVLATHLGSDNLPGLNSLLLRKLQERQVKLPMDNTTPEYQELRRCLISPDLGPLFINAPVKFLETVNKNGSVSESPKGVNGASKDGSNHPVQKTVDIVKDTLRLSKALNMEVVPLVRKPGTAEPITLFSKIGLGQLDMYVISPTENSKELAYVNEKWGCNGKNTTPTGKTGVVNGTGNEGDSSVTNLSSICCLMVWHPSNPHEKIVRVLFPGNASQTKIFEGLESLKNLPFMKTQYVTKNSLNKQKSSAKMNGAQTSTQHRATSSATTSRKPVSTAPKKAVAPVSNKKEAPSKVLDKRSVNKSDRQSKPKVTSAPAKSTASKEKIPPKSTSSTQSTSKSTTMNVKKTTTSRPGTASSQSKTEAKRATAPTSKPTTSKSKPQPASKVQEKPKKPLHPASPKPKVDLQKNAKRAPTSSPRSVTTKKSVAKTTTEKAAKKEHKIQPAKVPATPPEDLTPEFTKAEQKDEIEALTPTKPKELLSSGSEEPSSTSLLSGRHTPEGEDGTPAQFSESPTILEEEKDVKPISDDLDPAPKPENVDGTGDYVIMSKPEVSEENEFLSENGSSAPVQQPLLDVILSEETPRIEEELISSDKTTPPKDDDKPDKVVMFDDSNTSGAHNSLGRLPTPFHSLQDSSETTEGNSPMSESEEGHANKEPVAVTIQDEDLDEENLKGQESQQDEEIDQTDEGRIEDDVITSPAAETPAKEEIEHAKDISGEVHSSFNSSMEGSYELYPSGRSPPPPSDSRQETIAETISDYKHDGNLETKDYEVPNACLDNDTEAQLQHTDLIEDPATMSTEAPDMRFSMSTTSTESQFAKMEPPFSSSDIGQAAMNDKLLQQQPELADIGNEEFHQDKEAHFVDDMQPFTQGDTAEDEIMDHASQEGDVRQEIDVDDNDDDDEIKKANDPNVGMKEKYHADDDSHGLEISEDEDDDDNYPKRVWVGEEESDGEDPNGIRIGEEVGEHQAKLDDQIKEGEPMEAEADAKEDQPVADYTESPNQENLVDFEITKTDEHQADEEEEEDHDYKQSPDEKNLVDFGSVKTDQYQVEEREEDHEYEQSPDEKNLVDFGGVKIDEYQEEKQDQDDEDEKIQLTGSLASSAQDQGVDGEYSETTSLTQTGATPDAEKPAVDFGFDGPNINEYEQVERDVISKSDLALSPPGEYFPLHGIEGHTGAAKGDVMEHYEKAEADMIENVPQCDDTECDQQEAIEQQEAFKQQPQVSTPPRYHPAYLDPTAPLADPEEARSESEQVKIPELDSPLDVYARPFVPKGSVPTDLSPNYASEAHFGVDENFGTSNGFTGTGATSPVGTSNPFLMDLMSNNQSDAFNTETPCLPPTRGPDPCAAQDNKATKTQPKKANQGTQAKKPGQSSPFYVDLAYVPNHANKNSAGLDFFKKIRARYYVISGNDPSKDEPSTEVLNHLLEGKKSWFADPGTHATDHDDANVTVIPTHDTVAVREWYKQHFKELESCNVHMVASGSKVLVQVESIEACKIEF